MKKSPWNLMLGVVLMGSLLMVAPLVAQGGAAGKPGIAAVNLGPSGAEWAPNGSYGRMTLTVSGPGGTIHRQEFAAGTAPTFGLFDKRGQRLPDGAYNWELVAAPILSQQTREAMRAARRTNDEQAIADLQKAGRLPSTPLVQSGSFVISGGSIVEPDGVEPRGTEAKKTPSSGLPLKDQVIPDDLIVQGSACIGLDCVNNESFGFDTIRMKENNTRIKFEDTSVGSFPTNDWQLTANDSASGASSKFSIEDITGSRVPFTITAGAATNSIFADSTGRIGLRTSTPVLDLHINTSNTPAIRLEQNSSGGFTAQTWDIAGNEANFFVRDVTGGSRLPFRIRPGAPTSSVDISSDGDVGIGTASPGFPLDIVCNKPGDGCLGLKNTSATGHSAISFANAAGTTTLFLGVDNANTLSRFNSVNNAPFAFLTQSVERLRITSGGDVGINCNNPTSDLVIASGGGCANPASNINAGSTSFTATSSRFIKEHLESVQVPGILEKIAAIDVYNYDFIGGPKNRVGLMAEDFHQVFQRGSDKLLDGQEVDMALWLAVKELTAQNKALAERLAEMEAKLGTQKGNIH